MLKSVSLLKKFLVVMTAFIMGIIVWGYNTVVYKMEKGDNPVLKRQISQQKLEDARQEALLHANDAEAHYRVALLSYGSPGTETLRELQQTLRLKPDHAEALKMLGSWYEIKGKYSDAIAAFERLVKYSMTSSAYLNLGGAYGHNQQDDKALQMYRKAAVLSPNDLYCKYMVGVGYYSNKQIKEAKEIWQEVASSNGGKGDYQNRAKSWLKQIE